MAQHDAARADPQMLCGGRHLSHHDLGRGAGKPRRGVVLGQPIAAIPEPIDMAGERDGFEERIARGDALAHRRLIENAELHDGPETTPAAPGLARPLLYGSAVPDREMR